MNICSSYLVYRAKPAKVQRTLNIAKLQNPFSYQLKIVDGLQTKTPNVDLPETFNYLLGISVQTRHVACTMTTDATSSTAA